MTRASRSRPAKRLMRPGIYGSRTPPRCRNSNAARSASSSTSPADRPLVPLQSDFLDAMRAAVGAAHVRTDDASRETYGADALNRGHPADVVVCPDGADEVSAVMRLCGQYRVPLVPRGGGTGYTGGAVPLEGGVVLSLERMNRILEIDEQNLVV